MNSRAIDSHPAQKHQHRHVGERSIAPLPLEDIVQCFEVGIMSRAGRDFFVDLVANECCDGTVGGGAGNFPRGISVEEASFDIFIGQKSHLLINAMFG